MQIDKDMASPHRPLFEQVRGYLLSIDGITEERKPRITTYANADGGICHLRTMQHGIDIGFLKGARMEDTMKCLTGTGKVMRVLQLSEFNLEKLSYYIEQAIKINRPEQ